MYSLFGKMMIFIIQYSIVPWDPWEIWLNVLCEWMLCGSFHNHFHQCMYTKQCLTIKHVRQICGTYALNELFVVRFVWYPCSASKLILRVLCVMRVTLNNLGGTTPMKTHDPFPKFNDAIIEVWEWISNFTHTLLSILGLKLNFSKRSPCYLCN